MKKAAFLTAGLLVFCLTQLAHADFVGNKDSKMFFPDNCPYAKMVKKDNVVNFKTAADAVAAGYKASSKCKAKELLADTYIGNKSSKLYFPASCPYVKLIKTENKVIFKTAAEAKEAGYKASSKCPEDK